MSIDLEHELRAVLHRDADCAPDLANTWIAPANAESHIRRSTARWILPAASVAVVAAGLVGMLSVTTSDSGTTPNDTAGLPSTTDIVGSSPTAPLVTTAAPLPAEIDTSITDALGLESLDIPPWFATRTIAPSCGTWVGETTTGQSDDEAPLDCFSTAVANDERAEIVTVHAGDDLRVARWIVTLGPGPYDAEQFEVASLVVDERAGATRWFETRCVEGYFVEGRLVGDYLVGREYVDQLDPSGTTVTDSGEVVHLPGPDDRGPLQACHGPVVVDRPAVTPFAATGMRIGDQSDSRVVRFLGYNEVGEYDRTVMASWIPVGANDPVRVIGFIRSDALDAPPPPPETAGASTPEVIYADDGITRIGQFGSDGRPALDN